MPRLKARSNDESPVASPGVYECPWRDESHRRMFVAIGQDGQCIGRSVGDGPSRRLMQKAQAALGRLGTLKRVSAVPAPLLSRGVHRAPWRSCGDSVYVAVDKGGVCRAETVGMDYQASAYLWTALGDAHAEDTLRRLTRAQERRFQKFYRAGKVEREIRRLRQVGRPTAIA